MKHADRLQSSLSYCADLLKAGDEDRWLAASFAPAPARARLLALFALHFEIERAPRAVSEPTLGEIRLQWWREALDEIRAGKKPRAHPVVEAVAESRLLEGGSFGEIGGIIDARARLLYGEPFADAGDLAAWIKTSEGALVRVAGGRIDEALMRAATAYGLARFGEALAPTLDIKAYAEECWAAARASVNAAAGDLSVIGYVGLTPLYLRGARPSGLAKRVRFFEMTVRGRYA